jgi:uncharacterized membrane protein
MVVQSPRVVVVDMLRGVAMILMAIDHVASSFANSDVSAESLNGAKPELGSILHVLTGLLTNLASGIFFALAGVSVAFFEKSRHNRGWSQWQISRFLLIRAGVLFFLDYVILPFMWDSHPTFKVFSAIASGLIVLSFVRLLPLRAIALLGGILFFGYPFLLQWFPLNPNEPISVILIQHYPTPPLYVEFNALGRLSLILFGYVCGRLLQDNRLTISTRLLWAAFGGLAAWFVLRLLGGYGNMLPYQSDWPLIYFLIENKQPPSIVFLLFNLSWAIVLLVALHRIQERICANLIGFSLNVLGRTALFFYLVHVPIYGHIITRVIPVTSLRGAGLLRAYLQTGAGFVILVPLCLIYLALRNKYSHSIMQYL